MSTKGRLAVDITAVDKTRAAFASVNRQLGSVATSVNRTLRGIKQFRGVFAAAFVGLGVRAAIDSVGRAVDKNLVDKAGDMKSRWGSTWDAWGNTADRIITEAAMGLDGIINDSGKALGLIDQVAAQSVNRSGMGNFITPPPGATYGKGLPNNITDANKTAQAFQSVNTAAKDSAQGYKELTDAKTKLAVVDKAAWSFQEDILQGLDEEAKLLQIKVRMYGQSDVAIDAAVMRQQALNEAIAAGHPLSEKELALLDQKIAAMRGLGEKMDAFRRQEDGLKKQVEAIQEVAGPFKSAFSGFFQDLAQGTSVVKALKDELASLSQRLMQIATDALFEVFMNFLLPGSGFATSGVAGLLASFGGGFAKGGNLGAGKWGVAGEHGPELINGPASITPMFAGGAGGRGGAPQIHVHNNAPGIEVTPQVSGWGDKRRVDFYITAKAQQAAMPKQMKRR